MKKFFIFAITLMMLSCMTVAAGDIPEAYMHEDSHMFFGEVVYYHPDKEVPSIQVSPVKTIKGDVKEGTLQTYTNPNVFGNITLKQDEIYLFAYIDDVNGLDVFEVTTYDTETLKLVNVEGSMWERFETYLHEGKYGVAKVEERRSPHEKRNSSTTIALVVAVAVAVFGEITMSKKKE